MKILSSSLESFGNIFPFSRDTVSSDTSGPAPSRVLAPPQDMTEQVVEKHTNRAAPEEPLRETIFVNVMALATDVDLGVASIEIDLSDPKYSTDDLIRHTEIKCDVLNPGEQKFDDTPLPGIGDTTTLHFAEESDVSIICAKIRLPEVADPSKAHIVSHLRVQYEAWNGSDRLSTPFLQVRLYNWATNKFDILEYTSIRRGYYADLFDIYLHGTTRVVHTDEVGGGDATSVSSANDPNSVAAMLRAHQAALVTEELPAHIFPLLEESTLPVTVAPATVPIPGSVDSSFDWLPVPNPANPVRETIVFDISSPHYDTVERYSEIKAVYPDGMVGDWDDATQSFLPPPTITPDWDELVISLDIGAPGSNPNSIHTLKLDFPGYVDPAAPAAASYHDFPKKPRWITILGKTRWYCSSWHSILFLRVNRNPQPGLPEFWIEGYSSDGTALASYP